MGSLPLVSVITVTRNDSANLLATLESVQQQTYENIQHVIIDGASTDDTPVLLANYAPEYQTVILSEPDKGIFDAMNKGLGRARGELIVMMNGGDAFSDVDDLNFVVDSFLRDKWQWAYGAMRTVTSNRIPVRGSVQAPFSKRRLELGIGFVPHQAMYVTRKAAEELGPYDSRFGIAADQEMAVRAALRWQPTVWIRFLTDCLEDGAHAQVSRIRREKFYHAIRKEHSVLFARSALLDLVVTYTIATFWSLRDFGAQKFRG